MTSLGRIEPPAPPAAKVETKSGKCPQCQAPASKRVDGSGFGGHQSTLCGICCYEFKE